MAPPHPRGSTPRAPALARQAAGSPAPAGIDPLWTRQARCKAWLPRTRGDRPLFTCPYVYEMEAPPHPRGSTRAAGAAARCHRGSPAPAGIDPWARHPWGCLCRLPRTRGDRPPDFILASERVVAPPHPRGSTRDGQTKGKFQEGSPAPAGIDPVVTGCSASTLRLPRTRGDRPMTA